MHKPSVLEKITAPQHAGQLLALALFLAYALLPMLVASSAPPNAQYLLQLAALASMAALGVYVGRQIPWLDGLIAGRWAIIHWPLSYRSFSLAIWLLFTLFVGLAWATAEQIPLLVAWQGSDAETLAYLREGFLKARSGWQSSLVYVNAMLCGALLPYALALVFLQNRRWRWLAFALFLLYCISFMEKAFFLKAMLPLLFLAAQHKIRSPFRPWVYIIGALALLLLLSVFAGAGAYPVAVREDFFSTDYMPQGPLEHTIWRTVSIPLITAADALRIFATDFSGHYFWGASSSAIAGILGEKRIPFERLVFAAQWGQNETGTGSANSVFITEAYTNFAYLGVIIFSLLIGWIMRLFAHTKDEALQALWLLFAFNIFFSGLIGTLLSNGFMPVFFFSLLMNFKKMAADDSKQSLRYVSGKWI